MIEGIIGGLIGGALVGSMKPNRVSYKVEKDGEKFMVVYKMSDGSTVSPGHRFDSEAEADDFVNPPHRLLENQTMSQTNIRSSVVMASRLVY